jgi:hypothetical protein
MIRPRRRYKALLSGVPATPRRDLTDAQFILTFVMICGVAILGYLLILAW